MYTKRFFNFCFFIIDVTPMTLPVIMRSDVFSKSLGLIGAIAPNTADEKTIIIFRIEIRILIIN